MELQQATELATKWKDLLTPACARIEIAGSIRRGKAEVKDIDLVCIPKISYMTDLFGGRGSQINHLEDLLPRTVIDMGALTVINGPRQKKIRLQEGIKLELWSVLPPAEWGTIFLLRTGPEAFSHWLVTSRKIGGGMPSWMREKAGALYRHDTKLQTPEEEDVFRALKMEYIEPAKRQAHWMGARS
jgi:DNA polymerase/3'-5' exonuclease PolX